MFKALLAASLAMLACCAAAAWAGPVDPSAAATSSAADGTAPVAPLQVIDASPRPEPFDPVLISSTVLDGFSPIPLTSSQTIAQAPIAMAEGSALPDPAVQAAVIPLPTPLYAALALLGIALIVRRIGGLRLN